MINNNLFSKNRIHKKYLKNNFIKKFTKNFEQIFLKINKDMKDSKKTLNVLNKEFKFNFKIQDLKNFKKFKKIVVIGMGGSILGTEAIYQFLENKIKKKVYFFNNLDEKQIKDFKRKEISSKVLFIIISKSGNTIETLSNTFLLNIIKKNSKNVIIISEKKNNLLFYLANKYNLFYIEHNSFIGGRYSVLSEVGVVPSYLMGINILKLRSNIRNFLIKKNKIFLKESSIKLACIMNSKKMNNFVFLNYSPELEKFLFWCQQLIAESLGKNNKGFLPIISNVPKDHHSLLQLYLDGPKDKIFNIFSIEKDSKKIIRTNNLGLKSFLDKKKLSRVKFAQKNALIKSLLKKNIPFREFKIKKINEETLGQLFSYFIIETIIIGKLLKINPYDQPAVEQVKIFTKQILKQ